MDGYKEGRLLSFAGKDHFDLQIILSISCLFFLEELSHPYDGLWLTHIILVHQLYS